MTTSTIPEIKLNKLKSKFNKVKITSSSDSADYIRRFYGSDIGLYESSFILLLDISNHTIGYAKISQGGVTGTVVDVRIIAKYAVESLCSRVILAHNHPSGNLTPSEADNQITKRAVEALRLFDIVVLDHIILTENSFYSFADAGKI